MYWRHISVFQSIAHGPTIQFMECLLRMQIPRPHSRPSTSQLRWGFRVSVPRTPQTWHTDSWEPLERGVGKTCWMGVYLRAQSWATHTETGVCACSSVCLSVRSLTLHSLATTNQVQVVGWPLSSSVMTLTCWIIFGSWQSVTVTLACRSRCLPDSHHWVSQTAAHADNKENGKDLNKGRSPLLFGVKNISLWLPTLTLCSTHMLFGRRQWTN